MSDNKSRKDKVVKVLFEAEDNSAANIQKEQLGKYSEIAIKMFHTRVLTMREMLFPAFGELAAKFTKAIEGYRVMYFTDVLHINYTYVILITTLIGIYDVLNNPLMGMAYDKTRTRWGKARPYVVFGAIPYFACTAVLYSGAMVMGNTSPNDPKKILFVFIVLFLQETFSTIYSIPRDNMTTLMTPNPEDRIMVGLLNSYIGDLGAGVVYLIIPPLMELNNKGYINLPLSHVFMYVSLLTSVIGSAGNIAMAFGCRERILLQQKPAPITKTMFYVLKNKYAMRNFAATFAVSWWRDGNYNWDVVTQQEIFGGSIPSFMAELPKNILNTVSVTFIPKFKKIFKNNNKVAVIVLRFWDLITLVLECIFIIPIMSKEKRWAIVGIFATFYGINALNNGPANVFEAELGREINDYTEYVTGERPDGTFGILTGLIGKIMDPIGGLFNIAVMKWSGYDQSIPKTPWSQGDRHVYQKVFFLYRGINLLPKVVGVIPYFFYDLVGEKREQMYIALNERRALMAQDAKTDIDELLDTIEENKEGI